MDSDARMPDPEGLGRRVRDSPNWTIDPRASGKIREPRFDGLARSSLAACLGRFT